MSVNVYNKNEDKLNLVAGGVLYAEAPVGSIQAYGGTTAPTGWLLCQGQAVSRIEYADLFNAIGTNYGGSGSTFNLPTLTQCKQDYTVKTQIDTWRNSLEDGSESHTFTIDKDGSYYFEVVLSNATGGKESNNITITENNDTENNDLVCSWGYVGSNAILQNKTIFLKAGTYIITHICQTGGIGGTAVVTVYSTRNTPVGSYIIKAKMVGNISDATRAAISEAVGYSTSEQLTGGKWIDGKPVYRKVFTADSQVTITNSWKNVSGITDAFNSIKSNIEMISEARFFADASSVTSLNRLEFREDNGQVQIMVSGAVSITFQQLGIVLEYTKITD